MKREEIHNKCNNKRESNYKQLYANKLDNLEEMNNF